MAWPGILLAASLLTGCHLVLPLAESSSDAPGAEHDVSSLDLAADVGGTPDLGADVGGNSDLAADLDALDASIGPDAPPSPPCPASSDLIGCYRFESNTDDGSPLGNHAADVSQVSYTPGQEGMALVHGASSRVVAPDHLDYQNLTAVTVELWLYLENLPTGTSRMALVDKDMTFGLFVQPTGHLLFSYGNKSTTWGFVTPKKWMHVACTLGGSVASAYIDGVSKGSGKGPAQLDNASAQLFIGSNSPTNSDQLDGRLDTLRIWRTARTPTEICQAAGNCGSTTD